MPSRAAHPSQRIHIHLLSDSTGETLELLAKAALAHFDGIDPLRHFWPMIRSEGHLQRILEEIAVRPGLVLFTLVNPALRIRLETSCRTLGLPAVAPLDPVTNALSAMVGQPAHARPGAQHMLDEAYFARVDAIQYTIAHDDGLGADNWEGADVLLVGVSRSSKTPMAIYLANRGYKTANLPLVTEVPPPEQLFTLRHPLIVGLVTGVDRLIHVRRNRLLLLNEGRDTDYVDPEAVRREVSHARRLFADHGWPVIDMTRRSIEEGAAAIIGLVSERRDGASAIGEKAIGAPKVQPYGGAGSC